MDMLSSLFLAALAIQPAPAPSPSPAVDPDALCIAAILPGYTVRISISSPLPLPEGVNIGLDQERSAIAYYLGALRTRHADPARIDAEIAAALRTFRPHGPEYRFEQSHACVEAASRPHNALELGFPIHRLNALIGDRSSGRGAD